MSGAMWQCLGHRQRRQRHHLRWIVISSAHRVRLFRCNDLCFWSIHLMVPLHLSVRLGLVLWSDNLISADGLQFTTDNVEKYVLSLQWHSISRRLLSISRNIVSVQDYLPTWCPQGSLFPTQCALHQVTTWRDRARLKRFLVALSFKTVVSYWIFKTSRCMVMTGS